MIFKIPEQATYRALKLISETNVFITPFQNTFQWTSADYSREDMAQAVSFFLEYINHIPEEQNKRLGITFGSLSFLSIAFMLALIKSKRHYIVFYHLEEYDESLKEVCNHIFIVGELPDIVNRPSLKSLIGFFSETWNYEVQEKVFAHSGRDNLEFEFDHSQRTFLAVKNADTLYDQSVSTRTRTWSVQPAYNTGKIEESCVSAAMDNYIDSEDICILLRPFRHIGVATLSIYPAMFKAKRVIICRSQDDWNEEYECATNVHLAWEMVKENWRLPKKLRMVTSGGYAFNSDCVNYVVNQSEVDNIVDCYGTAVCPPPLAIRHLHKDQPALQPFVWINKFLTPENDNGNLAIVGPDDTFRGVARSPLFPGIPNNKLMTNDRIEMTDKGFYFYGNRTMFVRVNHERWTVDNFLNLFKKQTGIHQVDVTFDSKDGGGYMPSIHVAQQYEKIVAEFINNVSAEIILNVQKPN